MYTFAPVLVVEVECPCAESTELEIGLTPRRRVRLDIALASDLVRGGASLGG